MYDMFYLPEGFDIANYADGSAPYCAGKSAESVAVNNLEQSSKILFKWLNNNYMKENTGKSHLLLSGNSRATATIDNSYIESEDEQVLLGITITNLTRIITLLLKPYQKYLQESKSKVECPCKNRSLREHREDRTNHEVFCNLSI